MVREELAAWLRLSAAPGIGARTARRLLTAFGLPQVLLTQSRATLEQLLSPAEVASLLAERAETASQIDATWDWLQADPAARHVVTLADAAYPRALLDIEDPPLLLYLVGQHRPHWTPALAIVGSRNPTPQGQDNARQFARALSAQGLIIVSGLAVGIDAAAHEGALAGGSDAISTVAVVGTGLDRVYPRQHRDLAHRIAERGLLVSEYPLGTPPLPANFPRRNRIIAGLSLGTLVVEAAVQSGSLITARMAVEQGREVFAIPGSIHSPQSRGCHALIRQGAKLVESAQDVLEELQLALRQPAQAPAAAPDGESPDTVLLEALGHDPVSLDALVARTGISAAELQARLLTLELDGRAARMPGGLFQRIGRA